MMAEREIDLADKVCPYIVVHVLREVGAMHKGEVRLFRVADPLATRSVPEELADYKDLSVSVKPVGNGWQIRVARSTR